MNKVIDIKDGIIKIPYFLECKGDVLSYIENGSVKKTFKSPLFKNNDFHEFLRKVAAVNTGGIVFLVGDSGSEIYEDAKELAIHFSVRSGKLPVRGIGPIDTSEFKTALPETPDKKILLDKKLLEKLKEKSKSKKKPKDPAKDTAEKKNSADKEPSPETKPESKPEPPTEKSGEDKKNVPAGNK